MPIFEYKCRSCGHIFEKVVLRNETPDCDACHSKELEKIVSAPAIRTVKSQRKSNAEAQASRNKIRRDQKVAEREFVQKELNEHR